MLKTERLLLRQWQAGDFPVFAAMCADKDVMEFFPDILLRSESEAMAKKIQSLIAGRGWGFWAVEIPGQHAFIGFVGLHTPKNSLPFAPCVEIGWRLSRQHWGQGYAAEAARKSLEFAFNTLDLEEVVAFTSVANAPSRAVMEKIGMHDTGQNFMHPDIEMTHPLCEHVLYKIYKSAWQQDAL